MGNVMLPPMLDVTSQGSTSPPVSDASPVRRTLSRRRWLIRATYLLITLIGLASLLGLVILIFGSVSGTEFSPESLETRSFSYYEIPGIRWQVSPIVRKVTVGGVEQLLQRQQLVTLLPASQWDLVSAQRMTDWIDPRGASILNSYLRARTDDNRDYWADWTVKHSELAKVVWPEVIRLARRRLYIFIPDLMQLARRAADGHRSEEPTS